MLSNQYSNHPGEELRISDGLQTGDALALFPSESATEQRPNGNSRDSRGNTRRINAGNDAPLLAFVSEETLSREAARARRRDSRRAFFERFRPVRSAAVLTSALLLRALQHYVPLLKAFIVGVSRHAWLLVVRAARDCSVATLRLCGALRAQFTVAGSMLRHTTARLRDATTQPRDATTQPRNATTPLREVSHAFGVRNALGIVKAGLASSWRGLCSRTSIVVNQLRRQRERVLARRAASPAPLRFRHRVMQLHPWTYPVGLFVSGVAVGASLVTFARGPAYESVPAVTAVVSANQRSVAVSTNDARVPSTSVTDRVPTRPGPSESPSAPAGRPVSTGGVNPSVRSSALPPRQISPSVRPSAPPPRPVARADMPTAPRQAFQGSLGITSRPGGAAVYINGQRVGTTPLVLEHLSIGSRAVRLTLEGHEPWTKSIQVVAERRTTVTAALQASGGQ